jgi:hypothetical protein
MNGVERTGTTSGSSDPPPYDQDLLDEIDLLTELIVAATANYGRLTQLQIDELLGLPVAVHDQVVDRQPVNKWR